MAFWSEPNFEPLRKFAFNVKILGLDKDGAETDEFSFLAKTVNKPTVETDVNEYRLINQINKFPTIPKWNDITIKFIDTVGSEISKDLLKFMFGAGGKDTPSTPGWRANAISKYKSGSGKSKAITNNFLLVIEQLNASGNTVSEWEFKNPFIKSINYGELDYSDDGFVEVDVIIAYDFAYL